MSANIVRVNSDYKIQVIEGGQIVLDTGSTGSVLITGSMSIQGDLTTVNSTNTDITDNIIKLNAGETGAGISLLTSGIQIDRGSANDGDALILFNETFNYTDPVTENIKSGLFVFKTENDGIHGIQTNHINTNGGDLWLINNGTGKISVKGTTDYENQITDDDDIPNKKWVDDTIAYTLAFSQATGIANGDTSVVTYDNSTYAGISKAVVNVNNIEVANFQETQVDIFDLRFSGTRIETAISNSDMFFSVPGTGKIYFQSDLQVDGSLSVVGGSLSLSALTINQIYLSNNTIENTTIDSDLILSTNGTGKVRSATSFIVDGATTLTNTTIDNLDIFNSTVSTNIANTDLYLTTQGTGNVHVLTDLVVDGTIGTFGSLLTPNIISGNIRIHDSTIENETTNQDLILTAQGTGNVHVLTDLTADGDLNIGGTAYITGNLNVTGNYYISGGTTTFDNITISGSQILNTVTNDDLLINTTGTGSVRSSANFIAENDVTVGTIDTDTITINSAFANGTVLRSAKSDTNTLALAAYDVDGISYTNLITLTASNTPTLALTSTGVGSINNMTIGASTRASGAFTSLDASGNVTLGDTDADNITVGGSFVNGTMLRSAKLDTNTLSLAAYDVDGAAYTNLITLTASNTPTLALTSTGVGSINNMTIGASTRASGAFTSLDANGNVTLGDTDSDTITIGASFVTGTVLRSAKSATNTLALAAYDVNDAIYVNLITLTASNTPTLALTSTGVGSINNMSIGATTASTGAFTSLSASAAVTINTTINNQSYTTTGAGTISISSGTTGSLDNIAIGNTTRASGRFTTLSANNTVTIDTTINNQSYTTTGAGTITISSGTAGTIDNMAIGSTTRSSGAFTTLAANGNVTLGDADTDTITVGASFVTGTILRSAKSDTNTLALAAYDVDGATYTNLITLTASNTPTLSLTSTGVGSINNMTIGASTRASGAFTSLDANGNVTLGDATTDNITIGGSFVNGTVLRSATGSGNTLSIAAYDVDGAAYTNLIAVTSDNNPTLSLTSTGVGSINNMTIGASTRASGAFTTLATGGTSLSSAAWTTNGISLNVAAATFTDNSSAAGTVALNAINGIAASTLNSTNAITVTNAATLYIAGGPTGTGNTTVTNSNALYVAGGISRFLGAVTIDGSNTNVIISPTGTGTVTINPAGASTINNASIGATTASTGRFTTLQTVDTTTTAFDLTIASTSSTALTADRALTIDVVNASRTVKLAGNIDIASSLTTSGAFALTLTTTNTTNVTLPTSGTLYGTASASITSSQLATSVSDETGSGALVFATNPTMAGIALGNATSTTDADATVDAATTSFYSYIQSASGTARTINISNLTAGRVVRLYLRNTNAATKVINIAASTTAATFVAVNLAVSNGAASATSVTLAATSGTAVVTVFNAGGVIGGGL